MDSNDEQLNSEKNSHDDNSLNEARNSLASDFIEIKGSEQNSSPKSACHPPLIKGWFMIFSHTSVLNVPIQRNFRGFYSYIPLMYNINCKRTNHTDI